LESVFMLRKISSLCLLLLALALPLSRAWAAVDPNPFQNREPAYSKKTQDLLDEGQRLMQAGKLDDGVRQLNLAASLEPRNPYILTRLGAALNVAGKYQDALDRLRRAKRLGAPAEVVLGPLLDSMLSLGQNQIVLDLFPDPPADSQSYSAGMTLRARASALQVLGDSAGANAAMKRSLAILNDYDGLMTAGRIALLQGDLDAVDEQINAAIKLKPDDLDAHMLKIDVAMQRRNFKAGQQMADRLVADNPHSLSALLMRIKVYLVTDRADKVEADVDRILAETPMPIAQYFKAVILARHGNPKAAWDMAHSLPKEYLQVDPSVALDVANMAIAAGYSDSGASILNVAVLRFPWLLEPRLVLADLRLRQKSAQYALNTLTMVQDSTDPRVAVLFARIAQMKKDNATAQKYVQQAIAAGGGEELRSMDKEVALKSLRDYSATHPENRLFRKQYAILLLGFGELSKARAAYEALLREDPVDAVALNNLAWLVVQENPARALALAQRAVKADPSANNLDTLGTMQLNRADLKGAIASLQKARDLQPDNAQVAYHLALALEASGSGAQSMAMLQTLVKRGGFGELDAAKALLASKLKMVAQTGAGQTSVGR
jgi:tetratricopeptide (TPR) repeat protein